MVDVAFPFAIDGGGRVATTAADDHVRQLIEQLLFTRPGERVMRADFGCGVDAVFEPGNELLAAALELRIRGSLQRWLADVADVADVRVLAQDERVIVEVLWTRLRDGQPAGATFAAPRAGGAA